LMAALRTLSPGEAEEMGVAHELIEDGVGNRRVVDQCRRAHLLSHLQEFAWNALRVSTVGVSTERCAKPGLLVMAQHEFVVVNGRLRGLQNETFVFDAEEPCPQECCALVDPRPSGRCGLSGNERSTVSFANRSMIADGSEVLTRPFVYGAPEDVCLRGLWTIDRVAARVTTYCHVAERYHCHLP
jgi:hypothetical protein